MPPKVKCPNSHAEVDKTWLKSALEEQLKKQVSITKLDNVKNANGFLSANFKAEVQVSNDPEDVLKLFIKIPPEGEDLGSFLRQQRLDITEVEAYKTVLEEVIKFEEENCEGATLRRSLPKFLAGGYDDVESAAESKRGFFLALEDVSDNYQVIYI